MKTNEHQELLEDLLPVRGAPEMETMLAAVRADRTARASRRAAGGIVAATVACLLAGVLMMRPGVAEERGRIAVVAEVPSATVVEAPKIQRISDEELQESIAGPSAIITRPDGSKSLLVLMPPVRRTALQ